MYAGQHWRSLLAVAGIAFLLSFSPTPTDGRDAVDPIPNSKILTHLGDFVHDAGQLELNVTNWGLLGSRMGMGPGDPDSPSAQWPAGSGIEHLFAAGLWVGAIVNGEPRVSTGQYLNELLPNVDDPIDTIYRQFPGSFGSARYPDPAYDDDADQAEDEDPINGLDDDGDNQIDEDAGGIADQHFRCVLRDDTALAQDLFRDHVPLGIEVTQESFQWAGPAVDDFVGIRMTVRNVGVNTLDQLFVGMFADPDVGPRGSLGIAEDDLVGFFGQAVPVPDGSVAPLEVAYAYDGDGDGGQTPSYFGVQLLEVSSMNGGVDLESGIGVHGFQAYRGNLPFTQGGDPTNDAERYAALSADGLDPNPSNVNDWRFVVSMGPVPSLQPGEAVVFDLAFVAGEGLQGMLDNATNAALAYYGRWFDRDNDSMTGVGGRETKICAADFGPPGPANPIFTLFADCVDAEDFMGPNPPSPIAPEDLDENGCIYINGDCAFEAARGAVDCHLEGQVPPSQLLGCTGIGGRESNVAWFVDQETPVPVLWGSLVADGDRGGALRVESNASAEELAVVRAARPGLASRRWSLAQIGADQRQGVLVASLADEDSGPWPRDYELVLSGAGQVMARLRLDSPAAAPRLDLSAFPIPFNPRVTLSYVLPEAGMVSLRIADARGRVVRELVAEVQGAGPQQRVWNGLDGSGSAVASGVYYALLEQRGKTIHQQLVLVR